MSKPFPDSAGCGMHIHLSLSTLEGTCAKDLLFSFFLAGILYHMNHSLVMLLPHTNSYRRMGSEEFWTSSAVSYGVDSRSDAVRMIYPDSPSDNARIELRVAGGDVNPYLALYYCLKAGMWGIKKKLDINKLGEPGKKIVSFPKTLREASLLFMKDDSPARELYGDPFVNHYGQQRLHEAIISETLVRPDGWERGHF
jgi:glutamine synthetase